MPSHVFLATPCYGGVVTQGYMQSVCAFMAAAPSLDIGLTLALLGQDALITRCRNTLVSHFLATETATHLLFVDADISFDPLHVDRFLRADKPIVAGMYPLKAYYWDNHFQQRLGAGEAIETAGLHYVGGLKSPEDISWDGDFGTADFAGTGFMLIQKAVIQRLIMAYPETRYKRVDAYQDGAQVITENYALFDCQIDKATEIYMSEDYTFCRRWQAIGGDVWLDTQAQLTHTGPSDFRGFPRSRLTA